jgi:hypothetical protein
MNGSERIRPGPKQISDRAAGVGERAREQCELCASHERDARDRLDAAQGRLVELRRRTENCLAASATLLARFQRTGRRM